MDKEKCCDDCKYKDNVTYMDPCDSCIDETYLKGKDYPYFEPID